MLLNCTVQSAIDSRLRIEVKTDSFETANGAHDTGKAVYEDGDGGKEELKKSESREGNRRIQSRVPPVHLQ